MEQGILHAAHQTSSTICRAESRLLSQPNYTYDPRNRHLPQDLITVDVFPLFFSYLYPTVVVNLLQAGDKVHASMYLLEEAMCAGRFYGNSTQARVVWEEGTSIEKMPPPPG
ncbi:hypothetical protein I79_003868 [Cricetulus griseus]|uniref:Uncharacterized protein n=1 Tax=Cricetulus griseus TaxID=10029 RepID=G3H144_CRIGR|nr:hypothetical protein I79_003868 [Cricetulus griseus]